MKATDREEANDLEDETTVSCVLREEMLRESLRRNAEGEGSLLKLSFVNLKGWTCSSSSEDEVAACKPTQPISESEESKGAAIELNK
jgi:hypothetical protein